MCTIFIYLYFKFCVSKIYLNLFRDRLLFDVNLIWYQAISPQLQFARGDLAPLEISPQAISPHFQLAPKRFRPVGDFAPITIRPIVDFSPYGDLSPKAYYFLYTITRYYYKYYYEYYLKKSKCEFLQIQRN